ncbi:serine/threonine-protein kinase [Methylocaldum sp.]|uniref:serine/threonine-protein kinase n=1 Tax=Methylocaldum sp. TaxID=1969727 RepID=UPI00321FDDFA
MAVDSFGNLCMGCMQDKGESAVCPACGYRPDHRRSPFALPYQAVLNNKFLVGRILGKPGGFGVTYLAWDLVLHTTVAIKEYLPRDLVAREANSLTVTPHTLDGSEEFAYGLEQFLREARTLCKFSHPNVVRVREFFQQNNTAYLVMDYCEGISLEEYLKRNGGKLDEATATALMLPVLDGLKEVHEKGFLHRDIKPSNIYLAKGGTPILLDFGAARLALHGQRSRTLSVMLTPGFAPFEQYLEKHEFAPAADIYAIGATLYYLVTGVKPQEAISRYKKDEMVPPHQRIPSITTRFSQAVMMALAVDPERRPQTIPELRAMLMPPVPANGPGQSESTAVPRKPMPPSSGRTRLNCPHCKTATSVPMDANPSHFRCAKCGRNLGLLKRSRSVPAWLWVLFGTALLVWGLVIFGPVDLSRRPENPPATSEKPVIAPAEKPAAVPLSPPSWKEPVPPPPPPREEPAVIPAPPPFPPERAPEAWGPENRQPGQPEFVHRFDHPPYPPPRHAIEACLGRTAGMACNLHPPGRPPARGRCEQVHAYFACVPEGHPPPPPFGPPR